YFQDLVETKALVSLFDFENRLGIFPGVHRSYKFCLLTLTGAARPADEAEFVFFALDTSEVRDPEKRFTLTPEDIALLNPNTRTCPIFRTRRDAEIAKAIYSRVPVFVNDSAGKNSWGVRFRQVLFHLTNDMREGIVVEHQDANVLTSHVVPLYEAKHMHIYSHDPTERNEEEWLLAGEGRDGKGIGGWFRYFTTPEHLECRLPQAYSR